jgi:hypothetical protein
MSEPTVSVPPGRTPVFIPLVVLACFAAFAWIGHRIYTPTRTEVAPNPTDFPVDQWWRHSPEGRAKYLADLRAKERAAATSYAVVDAKAGVVRIPIDEAIRQMAASGGKLR